MCINDKRIWPGRAGWSCLERVLRPGFLTVVYSNLVANTTKSIREWRNIKLASPFQVVVSVLVRHATSTTAANELWPSHEYDRTTRVLVPFTLGNLDDADGPVFISPDICGPALAQQSCSRTHLLSLSSIQEYSSARRASMTVMPRNHEVGIHIILLRPPKCRFC